MCNVMPGAYHVMFPPLGEGPKTIYNNTPDIMLIPVTVTTTATSNGIITLLLVKQDLSCMPPQLVVISGVTEMI